MSVNSITKLWPSSTSANPDKFRNKLLRRIFKKYAGLNEKTEVLEVIEHLAGYETLTDSALEFIKQFPKMLETLEDSIISMETIIVVRDRSLTISSEESETLNNRLQQAGAYRGEILNKLLDIVQLAKTENNQGSDLEIDPKNLESLVQSVETLMRNYIESTKMLNLVFVECAKISSSKTLWGLSQSISFALETISGKPLSCAVYYRGSIVAGRIIEKYYGVNSQNELDFTLHLEQKPEESYLLIDDPKGSGTIAIIEIQWPETVTLSRRNSLLRYFKSIHSSVATTISNISFIASEKKKQHLESELETARLVQSTLLPASKTNSVAGLHISGHYESATECGGDWWNFLHLIDDKVLILLGDVTGHGTASAMLSAVVRGYSVSFQQRRGLEPHHCLSELNPLICDMSSRTNRIMTMIALVVDTNKGTIRFSNAGQNIPLLLGEDNRESKKNLSGSGSPLGFNRDSKYASKSVRFLPGETIFLFTDGLTECVNPESNMYGEGRLRRTLRKMASPSRADDALRVVLRDLKKFREGSDLADDVTIVTVRNSKLAQIN